MPDDLVPWLDDDSEAAMPRSMLALHIAATQVGVRESGGNNRGPMVDKFLAIVGLRGKAWCVSFIYWTLRRAGVPASALPKRWKAAGVRYWHDWAIENGRRKAEPKRGYLFYWLTRIDGPGHGGWVNAVVKDNDRMMGFRTIEGNTNFRGLREGDGVYRKMRTVAFLKAHPVWGFIDLEGLA